MKWFYFSIAYNTLYYTHTLWKVSAFRVYLVYILPHLDWIRRDMEFFFCIQFKCSKIRTRKTPNTDTFYTVSPSFWLSSSTRLWYQLPYFLTIFLLFVFLFFIKRLIPFTTLFWSLPLYFYNRWMAILQTFFYVRKENYVKKES